MFNYWFSNKGGFCISQYNLNKEQNRAVCHLNGPMLVLAGPGSGKTRVLTERIKYMIEVESVAPESILVITFSKKAAVEMQERFIQSTGNKSYPVIFGTFHSVFYQIIKSHNKYSNLSIITAREKQRYIFEAGEALGIEKASYLSWQNKILSDISYIKNSDRYKEYVSDNHSFNDNNRAMSNVTNKDIINNSDVDKADSKDSDNMLLKDIIKIYDRKCQTMGKIDFDDILILCLDLLQNNRKVLEYWQKIIKYILVDEFQDINSIQYEILMLLAGNRKNIFCVGDDDQSIYEFRGAKPGIMKRFLNDNQDAQFVNLSINYRCARNIIGAANTLIENNRNRLGRSMQEVLDSNGEGQVNIIRTENTILQANYVCDKIIELKNDKGCSYKDIVVLYRSGHCAKMFMDIANKRNIPVVAQIKPFNLMEEKEIKIIMSYLKVSVGKGKRVDYLNIINYPDKRISREALCGNNTELLVSMRKYYADNQDMMKVIDKISFDLKFIYKQPLYAAVIYILLGCKVEKVFKSSQFSRNRQRSLDETLEMFLEIVREFDSIRSFLDYIESCDDKDDCNENKYCNDSTNIAEDSVRIMTAHASKGLEFNYVFIIGLQEGLFPHRKNLHGESVEEERRLMYVAMTRAKKELYLCALDIEHGKQQSRFINEIMQNQSFISSNSSLSRNSSNASATASYSSSSSI